MRLLYVTCLLLPLLAGCSLDISLNQRDAFSSLLPDDGGLLLLPEQAKSTNFYPGTLCSRQVDGASETSTCFDNPFSSFKRPNPLESAIALEFASGGRGTLSNETSCFIASTGKVYCANINDYYLRMKEVDLSSISAKTNLHKLSVGSLHKCILDDNGKAYCWGSNNATSGLLGNGSAIDSDNLPVAVSVAGVLAGKTLTTLSAGEFHTCTLDSAGAAYCWGFGNSGRLGYGSNLTSTVPVAVNMSGVLSGKTLASIAAGYGHTCAIDTLGAAYCWGEGTGGKLGNSAAIASNNPVIVTATGVLSGKVLQKASVGFNHTCAIDNGGKAYCWGVGGFGQLGNGANPPTQNTAVAVTTTGALNGKTLIDISAGNQYTCAADSDGAQYCWGSNFGNTPVLVSTAADFAGKKITSAYTGRFRSYGLLEDGQIKMWIYDDYTKPLDYQGTASYPFANQKVIGISQNMLESPTTSCALLEDSSVYCWGNNSSGQLGNGRTSQEWGLIPEKVDSTGVLGGKTLTAIVSGGDSSCVLDDQGAVYCWGVNFQGQLGDGTTDPTLVPVAVDMTGALNGKKILSLQAGLNHVCGIADDYALYCWGGNSEGTVGDGTGVDAPSPVAVDVTALGGKSVAALYVRNSTNCVLDSDGRAFCWGSNQDSKLGVGLSPAADGYMYALKPEPVKTSGVLSGKKLTFLTMTNYGVCTVDTDGTAYCWGGNGYGLFDPTNTISDFKDPFALNLGVPVSLITMGSFSGCVLTTSNDVKCWGENTAGQLGHGGPLWNGKETLAAVDISASPTLKFKGLVSSSDGVCALGTNNKTYCWGDDVAQYLVPTEIQ